MTAFLLAIEGGDGVGKNTVSKAVSKALHQNGTSAAVVDYPRYGETLAGSALGSYLSDQKFEDTDAKAVAALYALDRRENLHNVQSLAAKNDVIIFDRYIASNMAYQSTRVAADKRSEMMDWIANLETEVFGLPKADLNVFLTLDYQSAKDLIAQKATRSYTEQTFDRYEADAGLQNSLRDNYHYMVENGILGQWQCVDVSTKGALRDPDDIAREIVSSIQKLGGLKT